MKALIYLAGPYAARERLSVMAQDLRAIDIDVTASWLDETHDISPGTIGAAADLSDAEVAKRALTDLMDVARADLLVLITAEVAGVPGTSGGRHVETGYAIGHGIPVVVVGEPENVFHRMGDSGGVRVIPDWPSAVAWIDWWNAPGRSAS